jgi:hypothetical protein
VLPQVPVVYVVESIKAAKKTEIQLESAGER